MRHEIETNCYSGSVGMDALSHLCAAVAEQHPDCKININPAHRVRIHLRGNGAALRDLIDTLDRDGWLD